MKKILTALLTFVIGTVVFYLFNAKKEPPSQNFAPVQEIVEIPQSQNLKLLSQKNPPKKVENLKPFFDSFGKEVYDEKGEYQGYSGWFMTDDFTGMPEVWTILLDRSDENLKNEKHVWSAMILTLNPDYTSNDEDNFHTVQIKTEGNFLSFRTRKVRGIEYRFEGRFFKDGKDFEQNEDVLRGTLRKFVKGKEVAKFTADFGYAEPHCFH